MFIYHFTINRISLSTAQQIISLFANFFSNLLNYKLYDEPIVWKDSYYEPKNKEPLELILTVGDEKPNIPKAFFRGNTKWGQIKLMWRGFFFFISIWKWMIYTHQIL